MSTPLPRTRPRRLTDTATTALLLIAAGGLLVPLLPMLQRAMDPAPPRAAFGMAHTDHHRPVATPGEAPAHPSWPLEDEDEPSMTELERLYPDGMWPGRKDTPPNANDDANERENEREREIFGGGSKRAGQDDQGSSARPAMGLVRRTIKLVTNPKDPSEVTGNLKAGELVMILKETDGWLLVASSSTEGVVMGWVKKSEIAVR